MHRTLYVLYEANLAQNKSRLPREHAGASDGDLDEPPRGSHCPRLCLTMWPTPSDSRSIFAWSNWRRINHNSYCSPDGSRVASGRSTNQGPSFSPRTPRRSRQPTASASCGISIHHLRCKEHRLHHGPATIPDTTSTTTKLHVSTLRPWFATAPPSQPRISRATQ